MSALLTELQASPLVAILRRPRVGIDVCVGALIDAGVRFVEVTIDSPAAVPFLESAAKNFKGGLFGAGTVTVPELAEKAIRAGARFLVTPNFNRDVIRVARSHQIPIFSGAMTPTEIFSAYEAGAEVIKVFPAATLGSAYFKELRGPFPDIPLMATGGITVANAAEFFAAGATALGVGSSLTLKDETPASVEACREVARKLLAARDGILGKLNSRKKAQKVGRAKNSARIGRGCSLGLSAPVLSRGVGYRTRMERLKTGAISHSKNDGLGRAEFFALPIALRLFAAILSCFLDRGSVRNAA